MNSLNCKPYIYQYLLEIRTNYWGISVNYINYCVRSAEFGRFCRLKQLGLYQTITNLNFLVIKLKNTPISSALKTI